MSDAAELAALFVMRGECPPPDADGLTGCTWAGDCLECWWYALTRAGGADNDL